MAICLLPLLAKNYKGGELRTSASYTYGKFEVRLKSAHGSGMLSSFFTYHDVWGYWNEIDIEIMGRYTNEVQFNIISPGQANHVYRKNTSFVPHDDFHVYSIVWTPTYVAWYIDGVQAHLQLGPHIGELTEDQKIMMNIWPPAYPDWAGDWSDTILPVYAYYDWVKYYSYQPDSAATGNLFKLEWSDDFDTWDQGRWQKATHTFDGNNCDFIPANVEFVDGYMVLCLTDNINTGYHGGPLSVRSEPNLPGELVLGPAFPNPFNSRLRLSFNIVTDQSLDIRVMNLQGQLVKELAADNYSAGAHQLYWDGRDDQGRTVSSGIYLINYGMAHQQMTHKVLFLK